MSRVVAARDRQVSTAAGSVVVDDLAWPDLQALILSLAERLGEGCVQIPGATSPVPAARLRELALATDADAAAQRLGDWLSTSVDLSTLRDLVAALDDALGVAPVPGATLRLDDAVWIDVFQRAADYGVVPGTSALGAWCAGVVAANLSPIALRVSAPRAPLPVRATAEERRLAALCADPQVFFTWPRTLQRDLELATMLVRLRPGAFASLDESLRSDRRLAALAMRLSLDNYAFVAGAAAHDVGLAISFLTRRPDAWSQVPPELRLDPSVVSAALALDRSVFFSLTQAQRDDPQVQQAARTAGLSDDAIAAGTTDGLVRLCDPMRRDELTELLAQEGRLYVCLPEALRGDAQLAQLAMQTSSDVVEALPATLLEDVEVMVSLMRQHPSGYSRLPEPTRAEPRIAFAACVGNLEQVAFVPTELLRQREFVVTLVSDRPHAIGFLPREVGCDVSLWLEALPALPLCVELTQLRERHPASFSRLSRRVASLGIACFYRFESVAELEYVLFPPRDGRPITMIIASPHDKSGSLTTPLRDVFRARVGPRRVLYREVLTPDDLDLPFAGISRAVSETFLFVHGGPTELRFGDRTEAGRLDLTDATAVAAMAPHLTPDGTIVVYACNAGHGGAEALNPLNVIGAALPGRTVMGPSDSVSGIALEDGVSFTSGDAIEVVRVRR